MKKIADNTVSSNTCPIAVRKVAIKIKDYYVYEWFIVGTCEVFYVGKGKNMRRFDREIGRNRYFINILNKYNCAVRMYESSLTEFEAFNLEIERISYYKSINQCRANLARGGSGGDTWSFASDEDKKRRSMKVSNAQKETWRNKTEEERREHGQKVSYILKKNKSLVGEKNPMYGKTHTDEVKKKLSEAGKNKTHTEETKEKMRERMTGDGNPMFGISLSEHMSQEDFQAYQERHLEICQSEEFRQKHREIALDRYQDKTKHPMFGRTGENAVNGKDVFMLDENFNIVREFKSIRLALSFLGIKGHSSLMKAIKNKRKYKEHYWTNSIEDVTTIESTELISGSK